MTFKKGESGNPGGKWRPGQSGNPGGRPKSRKFREELERQLSLANDQGFKEVAATLIAKSKSGDVAAAKEIMDRIDGKVATPIGGTDELPAIKGISWLEPEEDLPKQVDEADSKELH